MNLTDLEFKESDAERTEQKWLTINTYSGPWEPVGFISIEKANRILREKLQNAKKVYSEPEYSSYWIYKQDEEHTHTARLVCIEQLKGEK
jgi:hypothetical protein